MAQAIAELKPSTIQVSRKLLAKIEERLSAIESKLGPHGAQIQPDHYYSRSDIQAMGVCSWMTLLRAEQAGKLKRSGNGRLIRYRGSDLIAWLESAARIPGNGSRGQGDPASRTDTQYPSRRR